MKKLLLASAISVGAMASSASAVTLNVEIWDVIATEGLNNNPLPGDQTGSFEIGGGADNNYFTGDKSVLNAIGSRFADVTVNIDSDAFGTGFGVDNTSTSIANFFGITGADVTDGEASVLDNAVLGTVIRVTGFLTAVQGGGADIISDDGWRLSVGGETSFNTGINGPGDLQGPGSLDTVLFPVGANQAFEFIWFEGNVVDAQLQIDVNEGARFVPNPVPLPASALLLLGGLGGLGLMRRRKTS